MPHIDYSVNGIKYPSATELTSLLPQPWIMSWYKASVKKSGWRGWQKCLAQTKRGATIGSEVHTLLESFITNTIILHGESKYDSRSYADALYDAVNPLVEDYVAIEPHVVSDRLKIQGTADMIVRLEDHEPLFVGDWKTSAQKSNTHPIQLAIYALCWNEQHDSDEQITTGFIARVDKKSKKLGVKIDYYPGLNQYYPVIEALRLIYDYSNKQGIYAKED